MQNPLNITQLLQEWSNGKAEVLGVSNATIRNDWNLAKAWLKLEIAK